MDHIHTFLTTQGHGGPPWISEQKITSVKKSKKINNRLKEPAISIIIRLKRLEWAGHVQRMGMERIPKRILHNTIGGQRRVGKPRSRWIDVVGEDARRVLGTVYEIGGGQRRIYKIGEA
ncbi:hypothetical protein C0J52_21660 [Blattella germanica]|nr:hypothetical protein C0J52_21660 [Blattella germanica]